MGCHPKPIDELHDFSRWLLHHQPNIWGMGLSEIWIYRQLPFQEGQWGWSKDLLGHLWGTLFQMNPSDKDGGFFPHISSQKASKSEKKQWLSTLRHPDFPTSQVSHVDFPGPLRSPRNMLIPTGPGDGGTFHAISRCELTDVRVRHGDPCLYSNYLGMDPYLLSYFWGEWTFIYHLFWC